MEKILIQVGSKQAEKPLLQMKNNCSLNPVDTSLSVAGEWAGLTSIPSYSTRTPKAMDGKANSHTWSDSHSSGPEAMFCSNWHWLKHHGRGGLIVCGGLVLQLLAVGWNLARHWVGSGANIVVSWFNGQ